MNIIKMFDDNLFFYEGTVEALFPGMDFWVVVIQ